MFETGWRSYDTTFRPRSETQIFETRKRLTTLRCDYDRTLDFSKLVGVRTTLQRHFPKLENVCTTLCRDVDRTLDFLKPNGVRTTLRSLPSPFVIFAFFDVQVLKCCR